MGISGHILKKKEDTDINKLIKDVRDAANNAGLEPRIESTIYDELNIEGVYTTANIADTYDDIPGAQQWIMYLCSNDYCLDDFEWILEGGHLIRAIIIENFSECEKMLLDFLYEYLKLNPEDYFWDEFDWYYTFEDIKKIRQNEFDRYWCYQNPNLINDNSK